MCSGVLNFIIDILCLCLSKRPTTAVKRIKKIEKQTKKKNRLRFSSLCKVSFAAIVYIYYFIIYSSTCGIVSSTDKSHIRLKKHCSTSNGPCNIGIDILFQFVFWRIIGPKSSMCDLHRFWWPLQHRISFSSLKWWSISMYIIAWLCWRCTKTKKKKKKYQ